MFSDRLLIIIPSIRIDKIKNSVSSCQNQIGFKEVNIVICGKSAYKKDLMLEYINQQNIYFANHKPETERIYPGKARNLGLDYIREKLNPRDSDLILMVDDDIVLPRDYAQILLKFIELDPDKKAAMGRVESRPMNLATRIIDYSNFYYLQAKSDKVRIDWMLSTCTMSFWKYLKDYYFDENILVGEDVLFFNQLKIDSKSFGICAGTTAFHYHSRTSLWQMLKYQFENGIAHLDWHKNRRFSFIKLLKRTFVMIRSSFLSNRSYLLKNPILFFGVIVSFFAMSLGVEIASHRLSKNKF